MITCHNSYLPIQRLSDDECSKDIIVKKLYESTEEGQKVSRNKGDKFLAVYRRIEDPACKTAS